MKKIINFFAREHLLGNILTVFVLLVGLQALWTVRRDIWPDVDFNITVLNTFFPGASTSQVEKLVTNPIEQALQEVDGFKQINSISTENRSVIIAQLDREARSPDETNEDIRSLIEQLNDLPDEVSPPVVTPVRSQNQGVLEVTVGLSPDSTDTLLLHQMADKVADELLMLPLSSGVRKNGLLNQEYHVLTTWDKLARYQVSLQALVQSIQGHNISLPAGKLRLADSTDILFRTESQYQGVEDIQNTIVQANSAGFFTKISDVAQVRPAVGTPAYLYRANGKASINLLVEKKAKADVYALVNSVKDKLVQWRQWVGDKIELGVANDFSVYLTNRINTLKTNLLIGLALVVLLLTVFLPWPVALVVGVGIPVAFFATLALAQVLGFSINVISLLGLIIVLGMLVDDAIVVSENIWRHVQQAEELVPAVVNGAREVFGAVLASVLTTMSAFSPMLFMSGIMGAFIFEIPAMVVMALSFSLLEVFIIMPSHFVSWVGPFVKNSKLRKKEKALWFTKLTYKYASYVTWSLKHSKKLVAVLVLFVVGTGALVYKLNRFVLFPAEGVDLVFISSEAPIGASLEKTSQLVQPIEQAILKLPPNELVDFSTSVGIVQQSANDPFTRRGSHFAHTRIRLSPINKRVRTAEEILAALKHDITQPGFDLGQRKDLKINYAQAQQGPPQGRPIQFSITGQSLDTLRTITDTIVNKMAATEGVVEPQSSYTEGKSEWFVLVDNLAAAEMGLQSVDIARSVRAVFEGLVASSVRSLDKSIDIRVKIDESVSTASPDKALQPIRVGNRQGALVHLNKVAKFEKRPSISSIQHLDFKRALSVSSRVTPDTTPLQVTQKIKPMIEQVLKDHPGYQVSWGGQDKDTKESMASLFRSFWIALFFIFMLLVITFKNLLQPVVILSSVPLGFAGVSYAMLLHNRPFSFMAVLGMVALAGVIVNNSIVFIDFINKKRLQGLGLEDSIVQSARVRLRPIFLTTMTTVCGLLPTVYGSAINKYTGLGGGDPFVVPIALALAWGLAIGTFLVVLFMPSIVYTIDQVRGLRFRRPKALG